MILRLVICSSLALLPGWAAQVHGSVVLLPAKNARAVPAGYAGTVVWLEPVGAVPSPLTASEVKPVMAQRNKAFVPHVLAVAVGSSVAFPNFDPIFHNAFSNFNGQIFDIGLYPPGTSRSVRFSREGVVRVFCNIHASMSAIIVVVPSRHYTFCQPSGDYVLDDVPKGRYRLCLYHERATEQQLALLTRIVDITDSLQQLDPLRLQETAFLPLPHLNKYGKPYSAAPDAGSYPGARP